MRTYNRGGVDVGGVWQRFSTGLMKSPGQKGNFTTINADTSERLAAEPIGVDLDQVVRGEAFDVLRGLPEASFDVIVTDPPYCSGGTNTAARTGRSPAGKYVSSDSVAGHALPDFDGDDRDQRSFTLWCQLWLSEALRVSTGVAAILEERRYLGIERSAVYAHAAQQRLAAARLEFGWTLDLEVTTPPAAASVRDCDALFGKDVVETG